MQIDILKDYISRDDLAAKIGKSVKTLVRWELDGKGPPVTRLGREGPEHFCEEMPSDDAADIVRRWELADPRDRWRHTGEAPPKASAEPPRRREPYRTPQATCDAFWYVAGLDDPERVAGKRGLEAADLEQLHFHFADPDACLLAISRPDGTMAPTPLFEALCAAAIDIRPALIVVDSIAATFGGNQNDRVSARTFVGMFRRLARKTGAAILLLDHPSLSGITSGTGRAGSMDWQNATRARLHLETTDDGEGGTDRILEVKKINYGPPGEKVKLRWEDGCFVMQSETPAPQQVAAFNAADRAYLACLDRLTEQGREVREHPGRGYAPKVFADMPEAQGITARGFATAQARLFGADLIHIITDGPRSKQTHRIARKVTSEPVREAAE